MPDVDAVVGLRGTNKYSKSSLIQLLEKDRISTRIIGRGKKFKFLKKLKKYFYNLIGLWSDYYSLYAFNKCNPPPTPHPMQSFSLQCFLPRTIKRWQFSRL